MLNTQIIRWLKFFVIVILATHTNGYISLDEAENKCVINQKNTVVGNESKENESKENTG